MAVEKTKIYRYEFKENKIEVKGYDFIFDGKVSYQMDDKYSDEDVQRFFIGNHILGLFSRQITTQNLDVIDNSFGGSCVMYSLKNDIEHYKKIADESLQKNIDELQKILATIQNNKHRIKYSK